MNTSQADQSPLVPERAEGYTAFCYSNGCNGLIHPSEPRRYTDDGRVVHVCDTCSRQFAIVRAALTQSEIEMES